MVWALTLFLAQAAVPTQIERGEALFADTTRGCANCHALKGKGTAAGPDLRDISRLSPKAIAMGVRSTVTQYVQIIKLKSGESFPGMPPKDNATEVYDLSKNPPVAMKATKADVASMSANQNWKHPPATAKLSDTDMADVIAYVRFAGANNRQPVSPDDVK